MSEPCVHSFVFDDCLSCQQSALVRCDKELTSLRAERDALREWVREHQWQGAELNGFGDLESRCPECLRDGYDTTHAPDCSVPRLLSTPPTTEQSRDE